MYAYNLLVQDGEGWRPVRPGPDLEIPTLEELKAQYMRDLGFVPEWLDGCPPEEYVGVEEEYLIKAQLGKLSGPDSVGTWFVVEVEGSQDHQMPPLAEQIAWENHITRRSAKGG